MHGWAKGRHSRTKCLSTKTVPTVSTVTVVSCFTPVQSSFQSAIPPAVNGNAIATKVPAVSILEEFADAACADTLEHKRTVNPYATQILLVMPAPSALSLVPTIASWAARAIAANLGQDAGGNRARQ